MVDTKAKAGGLAPLGCEVSLARFAHRVEAIAQSAGRRDALSSLRFP